MNDALASGDLGFPYSFTTGSAVDGPHPRRRLDDRLHAALSLLPQPGHVEAEERDPGESEASDR